MATKLLYTLNNVNWNYNSISLFFWNSSFSSYKPYQLCIILVKWSPKEKENHSCWLSIYTRGFTQITFFDWCLYLINEKRIIHFSNYCFFFISMKILMSTLESQFSRSDKKFLLSFHNDFYGCKKSLPVCRSRRSYCSGLWLIVCF